jgi:PAS domain S-box-containing protein
MTNVEVYMPSVTHSEAHLRSLLENATDFAVYRLAVDPQDLHLARVILVSPSITDIVGVSDPYHFESWFEGLHPDDRDRVIEANERALREAERYDEVARFYNQRSRQWVWVHTVSTPVFDKEGNLTHFNGLVVDITEQKRAEEALQQQVAIENLITGFSTRFINLNLDEIDQAINQALRDIGEFTCVDRSYVFMFSGDRVTFGCTHEWCAPGVVPQIEALQDLLVEEWSWSNHQILQGRVLHVPSVAALPSEAEKERNEFQRQDIQSLIAVPMIYRGEAIGFLGFDAVQTQKTWSEQAIALLKILGEIVSNALEHKRAQAIQAGQRQFLELLATGGSLSKVLHSLVRLIEEQWPGMLGLILLLDDDGVHLHYGAAVSLPQEYTDSIENLTIGPMVGSCGTACYGRERVIVEDITTDPRWDGLRDLAVKYGLGACWSQPVFSSEGQVIGTFAMYYRRARAPSDEELRTIETAARLVGIAIEHDRARQALQKAHDELEDRVMQRTAELQQANAMLQQEVIQRQLAEQALRESETKYRDLVENANSVILQMDAQGNITFFNRFAQEFFGYAEDEILGRNVVGTIVPTTDAAGRDLRAKLQDVLRHPERYYSSENENVCKNGEPVWVAWTNKAVYDKDGRLSEVLCIGIDRTEQKQAQEVLEQQAKEQVIAAERNRLARDLHDAVSQTLFSTSLIAEVLPRIWERDPEEGHRRLEEVRQLTRGALAEMRTLLLELRPAALIEADLGDLLRQLGEATAGRARVQVDVDIAGRCPLSPDVQVAFYRIAQEALNNVAKHATADRATVQLRCEPSHVCLQICDDGRGFETRAVPPDHLGLGIMRERAEAAGIELLIQSQVGQGTQVSAQWSRK